MNNKSIITIIAATLLLLATSCKVEVENVTLNKATLTLTVGASEALTATVTPAKAEHGALTWTSSNPTVATVDPDGKVTAVANGEAIIMVAVAGKTAGCRVTVTPTPPPRIERWYRVGGYVHTYDACVGAHFLEWVETDYTRNPWDTIYMSVIIDWTNQTYQCYSSRWQGQYRDLMTGSFSYVDKENSPTELSSIAFSNGLGYKTPPTNQFELLWFGDYNTSVTPYPWWGYKEWMDVDDGYKHGLISLRNTYNLPNRFVILHVPNCNSEDDLNRNEFAALCFVVLPSDSTNFNQKTLTFKK